MGQWTYGHEMDREHIHPGRRRGMDCMLLLGHRIRIKVGNTSIPPPSYQEFPAVCPTRPIRTRHNVTFLLQAGSHRYQQWSVLLYCTTILQYSLPSLTSVLLSHSPAQGITQNTLVVLCSSPGPSMFHSDRKFKKVTNNNVLLGSERTESEL